MKPAIVTKYIPPMTTKGARIRASHPLKIIYIKVNDEMDLDYNHYLAACELAKELGIKGQLVGGALPNFNVFTVHGGAQ